MKHQNSSPHKKRKRNQFLVHFVAPTLSLLLCVFLLELVLYIGERGFRINRYELFRKTTAERAHYQKELAKGLTPFEHFDPFLGWRNYVTKDLPEGISETLNPERWRHQSTFSPTSNRKRIALVGDSFTFGWYVDDTQTVGAHLQNLLGEEWEVMNFGVRGYGLDQMTLVTTEILPRFNPDIVAYNFIYWDLDRCCWDFEFSAKKPYFELKGEQIQLAGVPVPPPKTLLTRHAEDGKSWWMTWLRKSRLVSLGAQLFLQKDNNNCIHELAPRIIRAAHDYAPASADFWAFHLDGKLPLGFAEKVQKWVPNFVSVPHQRRTTAKRIGVEIERHADGHPKGSLNRVYAQIIYESIRKRANTPQARTARR